VITVAQQRLEQSYQRELRSWSEPSLNFAFAFSPKSLFERVFRVGFLFSNPLIAPKSRAANWV
jgi:hypothetical protein